MQIAQNQALNRKICTAAVEAAVFCSHKKRDWEIEHINQLAFVSIVIKIEEPPRC